MGILGLTYDESGVAVGKLPITIKVAIGEGRNRAAEIATREAWTTSFSSGKPFADKMLFGSQRRT